MIDRSLLELSLESLSVVAEARGYDVTPLEHTSGPRITGVDVRARKLAREVGRGAHPECRAQDQCKA